MCDCYQSIMNKVFSKNANLLIGIKRNERLKNFIDEKRGSTLKDVNIPSSSTPFKNAPMAPRYPSCLRNSACWLPLKDHTHRDEQRSFFFSCLKKHMSYVNL